ncbi:tyrosine-type recombinase/integrase [Clostridium gasigenes]|uniref:tyrosine-type recombinase/integrase n=1 Tax=Clostridium gasigenes TaxID=94869 RepID=UPI0014383492|nr:tyrosine-type recombinase/integrase [Clostridium gasigenes]NKF05463.1 tyrosine-type recombinase/integrase [Clostridium gasigenes]QSW18909.1 tyrosine-type recombinase/integrase [Clostridium gasigenes]
MNVEKIAFEKLGFINYVLSDYIENFRKYIINSPSSISKETCRLHCLNLLGFDKFLYLKYKDINFNICDLNEEDIKDYRDFCMKVLNNSRITVNSKLLSIRLLIKYMVDIFKVYKYNFSLNIPKLKVEKTAPKHVNPSHIKLILNIIRKNNYGIRDVCICKIIISTGLKMKSIFSLNMSNIDLDNRLIRLIINNTNCSYPISDSLFKDLKDYINFRDSLSPDTDSLFVNDKGGVKNIRSFQTTFKNAVIDSNLPEEYTPQNLRASFMYVMASKVEEDQLKELSNQKIVKQYCDLKNNPLAGIN